MVFFEKSEPAPTSLAAHTSYRESDVIERLRADFKNKCYLCETTYPTSLNVEHFRPHRGDVDLKFNWHNLFYSCAHCNGVKATMEQTEDFRRAGILNCTHKEDRVDERVSYRMEYFPKARVVLNQEDVGGDYDRRVDNTIELLNAIYNGHGTPIRDIEAKNLISQVLREIERFMDLIKSFQDAPDDQKFEKLLLIRGELQNDSAFTAFKRWIVRDIPDLWEQI